MTTSEKVAYLKGLAEGYGLNDKDKEGKLLSTVIDILEDLALDLEDVMTNLDELEEGLDIVSEDLAEVEDAVFEDEDEDDDEDDLGEEEDDEELDINDLVLYEAECPACGEVVTFDEDVLNQGSIQCPACGESLEFDLGPDGEAESEE